MSDVPEMEDGPGAGVSTKRAPELGKARVLFGIVGACFTALAFAQAWTDTAGVLLPGWPGIGWGLVGMVVALLAAGQGWVALFEGSASGGALLRALYRSQMGKYIPGGVWQMAGQAAMTADAGVTAARAVIVVPVHVVTQLASGIAVGSALALVGTGLPVRLRMAALCGLAALVVLDRRWMSRVARRIAAWRGTAGTGEMVPGQSAIFRSFGWSCLSIASSGAVFAGLLVSFGSGESALAAVPAFALAWAVGFVAFPFPSGIGIREAALLLFLAPAGAAVVAASVFHRLLAMAAEAAMIALSGRRFP